MIKFILKRLLLMIPVLIGVSFLVFTIMYFTPGDPALVILGPNATAEAIAETRHEWGLDQPFFTRYLMYISDAFFRLDLGKSYFTGQSVTDEILVRLPYTLKLAGLCISLALILGIPLGTTAAINRNTWKDNAAMFASLFFLSMPAFWFALVLVIIFSIKLGWLPVVGVSSWTGYILPVVSMSVGATADVARQTRSSVLEVIRQDYVTTARAKGQKEHMVIIGHVLRNALIPVVVSAGTMLGYLISGALIAETIFSIPGMGTYMVNAIQKRDYPVIQGGVLVIAICFSIIMLLVDILMAYIDPRIRAQFSSRKKKGGASKWKTAA